MALMFDLMRIATLKFKWRQLRGTRQGKNLFVTFLLLGHVLRAQVSLFPRCFLFAKHDSSFGFPAKRERESAKSL